MLSGAPFQFLAVNCIVNTFLVISSVHFNGALCVEKQVRLYIYMCDYAYTHLLFILCIESYFARMWAKFCRKLLAPYETGAYNIRPSREVFAALGRLNNFSFKIII